MYSVEELQREPELQCVAWPVELPDAPQRVLGGRGEPVVIRTVLSCRPIRCAIAASMLVMCSEDWVASGSTKNGAHPAGSVIGSPKGSPPSGSVIEPSQSHSALASGTVFGAISSKTSNACSALTGWLLADRRSGSRPEP